VTPLRGQVWWAELPDPARSTDAPRDPADDPAVGYMRPVLIVSSDAFNRSRIPTVLSVVLSENLVLSQAPGNAVLPAGHPLPQSWVADVARMTFVPKSWLLELAGSASAGVMEQVEAGIRMVMEV
jgi:mRNA interferase MazF